jgi:hypothetical protein
MPESELEAGVRNQLREEYRRLLPTIRRVSIQLETEIRYRVLSILHDLQSYEQVIVKSRVKDCESAIRKLVPEGNIFDPDREYSMLHLHDLAGVRILVFPAKRVAQIDQEIRRHQPFDRWTPKPLKYARGFLSAPKYYGAFDAIDVSLNAEYQIVPMLMGNLWDVEHSAMYKPFGWAKGADRDHDLKTLRTKIEVALTRFERRFDDFVEQNRRLSLPPQQ